ncbi:MAG: acyl-CoA reductase [Chitinophagaceae bacterium]
MNLQQRIDLLIRLGQYILNNDAEWLEAKERASRQNNWFTSSFVEQASENIATNYLNEEKLQSFTASYEVPGVSTSPVDVGLVMAGNIPLVGFHDLACIFLCGHQSMIKVSSKDEMLVKHLVEKMGEWNPEVYQAISFAAILKGCHAYIATGSNNSARYFEYYFSKYPHIIRRNKTSVAILTGSEPATALEALADDVHLYFGLGCRSVTKIFVPTNYDFVPLLSAFKKFGYFGDHHKYKNNYDYQLAIHLINHKYYMTNGSVLLSENPSFFSPISQLNYEYYTDRAFVENMVEMDVNIQCVMGIGHLPFGTSQSPALNDFADGVDTMKFLLSLPR